MLGTLARRGPAGEARSGSGQISWPDYLRLWEQFGFNGVQYVVPGGNLSELTAMQAQRNPIVWACVSVRIMVFTEIRFSFQQMNQGKTGKLFGTPELAILEKPWPQATTGDLLARMELDASMYGNSYWVRPNKGSKSDDYLVRLNPTLVSIAMIELLDPITGKPYGKQIVGYFLRDDRGQLAATFLPEEVCHYRPVPDPAHEFRGASWLNALLPDIIADSDLTDYKHAFLQNAATPNLVFQFKDKVSKETFDKFRDNVESKHTGPESAWKSLYVGAGVDVKTVGSNFQELAFNEVQSAGETRIAAAAGVPSGIVGLSEAMKGSTLNAGNYTAIRRRFSDGTIRPLWRTAAGSLSTIIAVPGGSRLWYNDSDVPFLQEDVTDAAQIQEANAKTVLSLVQAGYEPDTVIEAVTTGDFSVLKHTGLVSVQLQKPGPAVPAGGEPQADPTLPGAAPATAPATGEPDPDPGSGGSVGADDEE